MIIIFVFKLETYMRKLRAVANLLPVTLQSANSQNALIVMSWGLEGMLPSQ